MVKWCTVLARHCNTSLNVAAKTDIAFFFLSHAFVLGVSNCPPGAERKVDRSLPHSISQPKSSNHNQAPQHTHLNGNHLHFPATSTDKASQENLSDEDEEESCQEEEDEEEEMEEAPKKWQGIEAIFEAYQKYVEGESVLRTFHMLKTTVH